MRLLVEVDNVTSNKQQAVATCRPLSTEDSSDNQKLWGDANPNSMITVHINNVEAYGQFLPGQVLEVIIQPFLTDLKLESSPETRS